MKSFAVRSMPLALVLFLCTGMLLAGSGVRGEEAGQNRSIVVGKWLKLGPIDVPLPAFDEEGKKKTGAAELLAYGHVAVADWPNNGDEVAAIGGAATTWSETAAVDGHVSFAGSVSTPQVAYLVAYVTVPRWMKVDVKVRSTHPFEAVVDGSSVVKREKSGKMGDEADKGSARLDIGTHMIMVKCVSMPADTLREWQVEVELAAGKGFATPPSLSLVPRRIMNIGDILQAESLSGVIVSPDGKYFAVSSSERKGDDGTPEKWFEIRDARDGKLVRAIRDLDGVSSWQWTPSGHRLSYVKKAKDNVSVRVLDIARGEIETVIDGVEHLGGYTWAPDESFIIYTVDVEAEKIESGVERLRGLSDRRRGERDRSYLYITSVPAGVSRRLTAGKHTTWVYDIHPDGKSVLIGRSWEDLSSRPYTRTEVLRMNLEDQTTELIWGGGWVDAVRWSPDGKRILMTGSPNTFGELTLDVAEGTMANDYDTQAFILDPATKGVEAITRGFAGTVQSVYWPGGTSVYLVMEVGERDRWYRYDVGGGKLKEIEFGADVVHSNDVASKAPVAIAVGSSANRPPRLYAVDLKKGKSKELLNPTKERFENVNIGDVEDFDFVSAEGTKIVGRVHLPPDFDANKKWPCIVYYYAGTVPVTRSFGGRYPKNLWAARGYVVYVLQPSGATGFGQEFSARHVNDWGKRTSVEIIEGVNRFLDAHPYVDRRRVGCIGASYGGFMTELLVTRTDIFAAAVSHAGISFIGSYWGEGYWGYGYNSVSAANSFPWNRRDIYVDQSPLFSADKVTTPLLLLHGKADTNVPRGESEQMYAALKILGKEVEYIRIEGQDHWILDYKKRIIWSNAIVSWFDRWLKDEPEWWNDMYPPLEDGEETDQAEGE